jgi:hypothetical protein
MSGECPICYEIKPLWNNLTCSHRLCDECGWKIMIEGSRKCPLCRADVGDFVEKIETKVDDFFIGVAKDLIEEKFTPPELHGAFQKVGFEITPERKRHFLHILKRHADPLGKVGGSVVNSLFCVNREFGGKIHGSDVLLVKMKEFRQSN